MEQKLNVIVFILELGLNAVLICVLLSLNGKIMGIKKRLAILSLFSINISTIIPTIGYRVEKDSGAYYFGFPADGFVYRGGGDLTFASLGLLFNFFFFYWIYKIILIIWKARTVQK
ncbi:hypothetical protein V7266_26735 [Neobacillus drentensis]|uniref:hypothetical protein n=1 Tax=Neobacillus drentensis TaxID=220684 RepID=UPI002FFE36A0